MTEAETRDLQAENERLREALTEAEQTLVYYLRELGSDYIRNTLFRVRAALSRQEGK